jgi:hypothetical protein
VDCGEEFRPDVLRCSDCGGELVARDDESQAGAPELPASSGLSPSGDSQDAARPVAWSDQARDLVPFADRLVEAGVVFRIGPRPAQGEERPRGFELCVREKDGETATRALAPYATPESGVTLLAAPAYPASGDSEGLACPACGTPVPTGSDECPECGLMFGDAGGATDPSQ